MLKKWVVGVALAALITGCASDAPEVAPEHTDPPQDQASSIRSFEPCGLLDRDYLDGLGNVAQLRPWGSFAVCSVELTDRPEDQSVMPDQIDVDLNADPADGLAAIELGTVEGFLDESDAPYCSVFFPVRGGYGEVLTLMADGRSCAVATSVAVTALDNISSGGSQRIGSAYDEPAASIDPCSVVDALPGDMTVDSQATSPYSCQFETGESIRIQLGTIASRAPAPITDVTMVQDGNRTFATRPGTTSCSLTYDFGEPVEGMPERNQTAAAFARIQPQLYVSAENCTDATELATAAADALQI
ncbi:hypothetical protein [Rhodococcoides kyotonense]|uniref:DUF3558 domain-containing protein n=1 Tax=Rhodococcoides kyotonense TaxID=398843 RepID=A0A239FSK1_9NOCA|nr:hypothetical protein [Rhodococcus kyotonensis]SNS59850.1 hypothetical protein SAMN05421642_103438 [Rhodococcus kyotonensis]